MSKVIPPYMSFQQALTSGYVGRIEDKSFTKWVKTLPCCACGDKADDPHHPHGAGFKGMGTKVPDYWCIPLCRTCHDELHHDVHRWEDVNGTQFQHTALTLLQAIHQGRMTFG